MSSTSNDSEVTQPTKNHNSLTQDRRAAASRAYQRLAEWTDQLLAPEDVEN